MDSGRRAPRHSLPRDREALSSVRSLAGATGSRKLPTPEKKPRNFPRPVAGETTKRRKMTIILGQCGATVPMIRHYPGSSPSLGGRTPGRRLPSCVHGRPRSVLPSQSMAATVSYARLRLRWSMIAQLNPLSGQAPSLSASPPRGRGTASSKKEILHEEEEGWERGRPSARDPVIASWPAMRRCPIPSPRSTKTL